MICLLTHQLVKLLQAISGFILDSTKSMDILISRNAVPQAVEAYVKYLTGVRGKKQVFNPHPVQDVQKNVCILQCLAAYMLYR